MWSEALSIGASSLLILASVVLAAVGLVGCVLPYPGHLFMMAACALLAWAGDKPGPSWYIWLLLVVLTVLGFFVDSITTAIGAKKFGSSRLAIFGSLLGVIIGAFFFPLGLILGPFLGAFIAEIAYHRKTLRDSGKAATGALLGYVAGVFAKLLVAMLMYGIVVIYQTL